jgi:hypothetical protein
MAKGNGGVTFRFQALRCVTPARWRPGSAAKAARLSSIQRAIFMVILLTWLFTVETPW